MSDPYLYPGTGVLRNKFGIRDARKLEAVEYMLTREKLMQGYPKVELSSSGYRAIHKYLFSDIYDWAGELRTVDMSKGSSIFCRPAYIESQLSKRFSLINAERNLRGLTKNDFSKSAAEHISEINAIHPFREGNGRTQITFLSILSEQAAYYLDPKLLANEKKRWIEASIQGFSVEPQKMQRLISEVIISRDKQKSLERLELRRKRSRGDDLGRGR